MSDPRYLPTVVALALAAPAAVLGLLGAGLALLGALARGCSCGGTHGSTHGAYTAVTPLGVSAGQRIGRGLTVS